jgi:dihydroorotate dehydrogenase
MLESLLGAVAGGRKLIASGQAGNAPILVKLAPDLTEEELDDAVGVILDRGMDGIVVTNTTLGREGLKSKFQGESGGLSGGPLRVRSETVLRQVVGRVNGRVPIISAGGIMGPEDAKRRLDLGAALIQIYTGLVYRGPRLVKDIVESL